MNRLSKLYFWLKCRVLGEEKKTYEINLSTIESIDAISIVKKESVNRENNKLSLSRKVKVNVDGNKVLLVAPYNYWFIPTSKGFYYFEVQVQDDGDNKSIAHIQYKMNLFVSSIILFFVLCLSVYLIFISAVFLFYLFVLISGHEVNTNILSLILGSIIGALILAGGLMAIRYLDKGHKRFVENYLSGILKNLKATQI